ncbi:MAG: ABC transporter permease [Gemmatimonadales bacterium]
MREPSGRALYRILLHLLPGAFRRRFGREMEALFFEQVASRTSRSARLRHWGRGVADLVVQGAAERTTATRYQPRSVPPLPGDPMGTLLHTLRYAMRTLLTRPAFTLSVVLTLGLGIGLATTMALVVDGVLLRPLPYPDADRLIRISERTATSEAIETSLLTFADWRARADRFEAMAAVVSRNTIVTGRFEPARVPAMFVTGDFFALSGVRPALGRSYGAAENRPDAAPVVVVSHEFWRDNLGAPGSLAQVTITLSDLLGRSEAYAVVGVMPPGFDLLGTAKVYLPLERGVPWSVRNHTVRVLGRLKPGVALETGVAQLNTVQAAIKTDHPETDAIGIAAQPLSEEILGPVRRPLLLLLGSAGLLLLIACINVAGALLARGVARQPEMQLRAALGATRGRIFGQLFAESALLATASTILAIGIARGLFGLLGAVDPMLVPRLAGASIDWSKLILIAAVLANVGVGIFGSSSAWFTTRWAAAGLRVRGGGAQRGQHTIWRLLLGAEVALAFMLLVSAGLLGRSLYQVASVDTGFDPRGVTIIDVNLPSARFPTPADHARYFDAALRSLRNIPGVAAAGLNILLPLPDVGSIGSPLHLEQGEAKDVVADYRVADEGYFAALRIPLLRGRLFDDRDRAETAHSVIVGAALARRLWGDADPLGKRFSIPGMDGYGDAWLNVVGVVADARAWNVEAGKQLTYYVNFRQRPTFLTVTGAKILVRGEGGTLPPSALRRALVAVDPGVPLRIRPLEELIGNGVADKRLVLNILALFAGLALVLSAVGIWSVSSFVISRRIREMGIRLAIGATPRQVRRLLQREAMLPLLVGLIVGTGLAIVVTRWIRSLLFGVSELDGASFIAAAATLAVTTWIASYLPARRTAKIDPIQTLRAD